jgi:hypothetical protein
MKLEEPCDGRLSSTVPWERKGETPLRDPIISNLKIELDKLKIKIYI